jgi:hypothetical protein
MVDKRIGVIVEEVALGRECDRFACQLVGRFELAFSGHHLRADRPPPDLSVNVVPTRRCLAFSDELSSFVVSPLHVDGVGE